jgi:hypothetical protein
MRKLWDDAIGWVLPAQAGLLFVMIVLEVLEKPKGTHLLFLLKPTTSPSMKIRILLLN